MAKNMESSAREAFPMAARVTGHFHRIRLAQNAMQAVRIKLSWKELDQENKNIAKENNKYKPTVLENRDNQNNF